MSVKSRWPSLLEMAKVDDGLAFRDCGSWTADKLFFWHEYLSITTTAMVGNSNWKAGLSYVDLFAGPGICRVRETGQRLPGSAIIAAHAPKPFEVIHLAELDAGSADACEARMKLSPAKSRFHMHRGDCNQLVHAIAKALPLRSLTLAFVDPPGLDIEFDSLRALCTGRAVDLLVLFADAVDAARNVDLYEAVPEHKMDRMLGEGSEWRDRWSRLLNRVGFRTREFFASEFIEQLKKHLKYTVFRQHTMAAKGKPLYRIIYASRNDRGLDFWNKAVRKDRQGQSELF
ncbi:MAG: three-Cys-motif partner protein TcmP [Phycisphaerae bacterium]|nr:three-Cys-motif partner protein TcmP [Phycisphaerae bacterium]